MAKRSKKKSSRKNGAKRDAKPVAAKPVDARPYVSQSIDSMLRHGEHEDEHDGHDERERDEQPGASPEGLELARRISRAWGKRNAAPSEPESEET